MSGEWDRELYTVRSLSHYQWRVVKFDGWFNVLGESYVGRNNLNGEMRCTCPRHTFIDCRHRLLVRKFEEEKRVDTGWFYDYEFDLWERPVNHPIRIFRQKVEKAKCDSR